MFIKLLEVKDNRTLNDFLNWSFYYVYRFSDTQEKNSFLSKSCFMECSTGNEKRLSRIFGTVLLIAGFIVILLPRLLS